MGGDPHADTHTSTELNLDGKWTIYVVVGWNGKDEAARRLGPDGGLDLLHRAASVLHNALLLEENGERLPIAQVEGIDVLADSALDLSNLWIGAVSVLVEMPLPLLESESCYGPLDDFLKIRGPLVVPDPADDIEIAVDLPQT